MKLHMRAIVKGLFGKSSKNKEPAY